MNHTVVLGVDIEALLSLQVEGQCIEIPFRRLLKRAKLSWRDIDTISLTTIDNVNSIAEEVEAKNQVYDEFMEYVRLKKERYKAEVLPILKNTKKEKE